jgi:fatty-acyl-CoA synthase
MAGITRSYVHGAAEVPLSSDTIGTCFDRAAELWGDREALYVRHQDIRWTYAKLKQEVDDFAAGLIALGLKPGDRVGVWSPNCAQWTVAQFATAKAGLIQVNINPAYRVHEVEFALTKVGCKALVTADNFKNTDYVGMLEELAPEIATSRPGQLQSARLPELKVLIRMATGHRPGYFSFSDVAASGGQSEQIELARLAGELQFDDPINIQFTSGTTGSPKGATLTHHGLVNNALFGARAMRYTEQDRVCIPVPLYHCFGMVIGNMACVLTGAAMIYPAEAFDPLATLEVVESERCTSLYGVPTMYVMELNHPEFTRFDLSSLRTGAMGGSPCPVEIMRRVIADMNMKEVTICYGMTELSPISFQTQHDDTLERRVGTVGRVHPHVEAKIVDAEGRIVPLGTSGEVCARGYSVMSGYWNDEEKTRETIDQQGWLHTGDVGAIDADGYLNITGRIKDMVIRGGENIYPREIEEFFFQHPKVADVQVIGVPDDKYGEELCAWIKLKPGMTAEADEMQAFCRGRITHFKIPRYIRFVDAFPLTVTGKVQKFAMREQMKQELGVKEQKTA